ncbi:hypothetical protein MKZ38_008470 [Zalerion maritima]|uniref:GPI inositol-deacylase winged helix domain-containing protein n=1 Tax=Zalerion maritima TaxID=339359 RepID=A0AAD5WTW6_9PEZI|nr:hypothetical protein MKZ38_008470 [Zalerion maritima]
MEKLQRTINLELLGKLHVALTKLTLDVAGPGKTIFPSQDSQQDASIVMKEGQQNTSRIHAALEPVNTHLASVHQELGPLKAQHATFSESLHKVQIELGLLQMEGKVASDAINQVQKSLGPLDARAKDILLSLERTRKKIDAVRNDYIRQAILHRIEPTDRLGSFHHIVSRLTQEGTGLWFSEGKKLKVETKLLIGSSIVSETASYCNMRPLHHMCHFYFSFIHSSGRTAPGFLRTILKQLLLQMEVVPTPIEDLFTKCQHVEPSFEAWTRAFREILPRTLDETYERILPSVPHEQRQDAHKSLTWIVCAARPLTTKELAEASIIQFDSDIGVHPQDRLFSPESILGPLSTLISIHLGQIRSAHYSVEEYLTSLRASVGAASSFFIPRPLSDERLARSCVRYWVLHAKRLDVLPEFLVEDIKIFLENPRAVALWESNDSIWRYINYDRGHSSILGSSPRGLRHTIYYACLVGMSPAIKLIVCQALEGSDNQCTELLNMAIRYRYKDVVREMLGSGVGSRISKTDAADVLGGCLLWESEVGFREASGGWACDWDWATPTRVTDPYHSLVAHWPRNQNAPVLSSSLHNYHTLRDVANLTPDRKADVRGRDTNIYVLSLAEAISNGDTVALQLLIDFGEAVNNPCCGTDTPLIYAMRHGSINQIQILLQHGSDVARCDSEGSTALHHAVKPRHLQAFRALLRGENASPDIHDDRGRTLLCLALNPHLEVPRNIVVVLLIRSAPSFRDGEGRTPLHIAISLGNEPVVKYLIKNGDNLDVQDRQGRKALQDHSGQTPLFLATSIKQSSLARIVDQLWDNAAFHDGRALTHFFEYPERQPPRRLVTTNVATDFFFRTTFLLLEGGKGT